MLVVDRSDLRSLFTAKSDRLRSSLVVDVSCCNHCIRSFLSLIVPSRNESIQLDRFSVLNVVSWKNGENLSFAICDDFIRTNKNVLIAKHCTTINPLVLLLFTAAQEPLKLNEYEITLAEKNLFQLRTKINACLKRKLQSLGNDAMVSNNGCHCVNLLVKIFSQIS